MQPTHNEQTLWQQNRKFNTPNIKAADRAWSEVQNQSNSDIEPPQFSGHESLWPAARSS